MTDAELDALEGQVPALAAEAIAVANQRARESGRPQVLVKNGAVVRIENGVRTVLEVLPPRVNVTTPIGSAPE